MKDLCIELPAANRPLRVLIRALVLKQPPMEAVVTRET
jgi:hypothetical protein